MLVHDQAQQKTKEKTSQHAGDISSTITGIGTDLCDSNRIQKLFTRFGETAKRKLFTPAEIEYCESKNAPVLAYAKRFAAKEAVLKALGTGLRKGFSWQQIEVQNNQLGAPSLTINHPAATGLVFHLSLSDETPYALAFVIACQAA